MTSVIKAKQPALHGLINVSDMNNAIPDQYYTVMWYSCTTGTNTPANDGTYWGFTLKYDENSIVQVAFGRYHSYHRYCVWGTWENWIAMS